MKIIVEGVYNILPAISGMRKSNCRKIGNKYEAYLSIKGRFKSLGTYATEEEAKEVILKNKIENCVKNITKYENNLSLGKIWGDSYIVFPSGNIFNAFGKLLIGHLDRNGYRCGIIKSKNVQFHRIVASTFIPNPLNKPCVNHIDGNKSNNNINNLEWCTNSENIIHAYKTGLEHKVFGENHHAHKLTKEAVTYIRNNLNMTIKELADKFNVSTYTIYDVLNYKTWRNINED
jgi:predicted DNA-binding protein YlxM (UPF0122 family)